MSTGSHGRLEFEMFYPEQIQQLDAAKTAAKAGQNMKTL